MTLSRKLLFGLSISSAYHYVHATPAAKVQRKRATQPAQVDPSLLGGYQVVGNSVVAAQQLFLGDDHQVYIIDKAENNPTQINGHAAWAAVYDLDTNTATPLEVITNTFCACGGLLGNGTWLNVGGNQAVDPGGNASASQTGANTYQDSDGRFRVRIMTPGDGAQWSDNTGMDMSTPRWYPAIETLDDGRAIIIGGDNNGGFVNDAYQNNPTYEFWPRSGTDAPIFSPLLNNSLPANLYAITHLLPSGRLFLNSNRNAAIIDYHATEASNPVASVEIPVDDVPDAVRTYPASASSALLPLNSANNYTATIMYCGGTNITDAQWTQAGLVLIDIPGSTSCVKISPDVSSSWEDEDPLPEGRVMGNGILLPDGTVLVINGAGMGVAGYADATQESWSAEDSLATDPTLTPVIYNPKAPSGSKWSRQGLSASTIPRMYHSVATLLPDGSVFIAGSNPHADYTPTSTYPTEYRVEKFYPLYYNSVRPEPQGIPTSLTYGGSYFNVTLSKADLTANGGAAADNVKNITISVMKTGFSTHALNFGMRTVELDYSYALTSDGGATLFVSQLPPNSAIIQPGTAWIFLAVNGVPSIGQQVMLGTGQIGQQPTQDVQTLPSSSDVVVASSTGGKKNAGERVTAFTGVAGVAAFSAFMSYFML